MNCTVVRHFGTFWRHFGTFWRHFGTFWRNWSLRLASCVARMSDELHRFFVLHFSEKNPERPLILGTEQKNVRKPLSEQNAAVSEGVISSGFFFIFERHLEDC